MDMDMDMDRMDNGLDGGFGIQFMEYGIRILD